MMIHSFQNQHTKIRYVDGFGEEGYLKPGVSLFSRIRDLLELLLVVYSFALNFLEVFENSKDMPQLMSSLRIYFSVISSSLL